MNVEYVVNEQGKPKSVIIPYELFQKFQEWLEDQEDIAEIRKIKKTATSKDFISLEEVKQDLGLN